MARRGRYRRFLEWVSATRRSRIAADFVSSIARNFGLHGAEPGGCQTQQHINYFSTQSLQKLLVGGGSGRLHPRRPADQLQGYASGRLGLSRFRRE